MKKYILERHRDEYEDYVLACANFMSEEMQQQLCGQDGTNWYCKKDEFDFRLADTLDEVVSFFKEYNYVQDKKLEGLSEEDRAYVKERL